MEFDAAVALVILAVLLVLIAGLVWWARRAPAYDDGMGASYVEYVPEPPDPRLLPGQIAAARHPDADAADDGTAPAGPGDAPEERPGP